MIEFKVVRAVACSLMTIVLAIGNCLVPVHAAQAPLASPLAGMPPVEKFSVTLPPIVEQFKVDVKKDCGAVGDGVTNDTAAFYKAAQLLEKKGGGTLIIPKATYIVGKQSRSTEPLRYYRWEEMFEVDKVDGLLIEGNGATLRHPNGIRFGSFDPVTGEIYNPPKIPFVDTRYVAQIGSMIQIRDSRNIVIRNLELDGNNGNLALGGIYGDAGRQVRGCGLWLMGNRNVHLDRVYSHHHGLDGALIGAPGLKEADSPTPTLITDCTFEYNARQGLSWVGGRGMQAYRSKFNHTGRSYNESIGKAFNSSPGAGLDIEAEGSVTREGYFEDCEFLDNTGPGMVSDSGDGGHTQFKNCTFWGTTQWSCWSNKPGIKFEDCRFYGSAIRAVGSPDPALATSWLRCTFEDKPWTNGKVYRNSNHGLLLEISGNLQNVILQECTFIANNSKSIWANGTPEGNVFFDRCAFTHKYANLPTGEFQALFRRSRFAGCHFTEEFPADVARDWFIIFQNCTVLGEPPTTVDGPYVRCNQAKTGFIGTLPATSQ